MSKTTEEEWKARWEDKTTEPYTVVHIVRGHPTSIWYNVYYRTYTRAVYRTVRATDELGAYVAALTELAKCKKASDRAYRKKEQTK